MSENLELRAELEYEVLLYTKTRTSDFKLLVEPARIESSDLDLLKTIIVEGLKPRLEGLQLPESSASETRLLPLYFFPLRSHVILIRAIHTDRVDKDARKILWDFAGISVERSERMALKRLMPHIIASSKIFKLCYQGVNLEIAAPLIPPKSKIFALRYSCHAFSQDERAQFRAVADTITQTDLLHFWAYSPTPEGYDELTQLLLNPFLPLLYFAFGPITDDAAEIIDGLIKLYPDEMKRVSDALPSNSTSQTESPGDLGWIRSLIAWPWRARRRPQTPRK